MCGKLNETMAAFLENTAEENENKNVPWMNMTDTDVWSVHLCIPTL